MDRTDAVIEIDRGLEHLDKALEMLKQLGAGYGLLNDLRMNINRMYAIRSIVTYTDLQKEGE